LIGKAVANMEEVKKAKKQDHLLIAHGSTNVAVPKSFWEERSWPRCLIVIGIFRDHQEWDSLYYPGRRNLHLGFESWVVEPPADTMSEMLRDFGADSVS